MAVGNKFKLIRRGLWICWWFIFAFDGLFRLFGIKCSVCNQHVPGQELVMRVLGNIYHMRCFLCSFCGQPLQTGDEFIIRNGRLICARDFGRECIPYPQCMSFLPPPPNLQITGMEELPGTCFVLEWVQTSFSPDICLPFFLYLECQCCFWHFLGDENNNILMLTHAHSASETARRGPKRPRTILTSHQRRAFKSSFEVSPKPCRKVRESLASDLGLSVRVVQVRDIAFS